VDLADVQCDGDVDPVDSLQVLRWDGGLSVNQQAGCTPIGQQTQPVASSYDLINAAFEAGDIDAETSLTYRVFATFGDARLPVEFKGDDEGLSGTSTVLELGVKFDTLSVATQELLAPFLKAPDEPDSWFAQRMAAARPAGALPQGGGNLAFTDSSPHVRIHWRVDRPGDAAVAEALADVLDNEIWPTLTGLMGEPLPDVFRPGAGDARIDVTLTGMDIRAHAESWPSCGPSSAFIALGTLTEPTILAHEFMHAILFGFPLHTGCIFPEYDWIHEATATWAIDYVYPQSQAEWGVRSPTGVLTCFLANTNESLETTNDCHEYGAYLFLFYLARFHTPQLIRDIWEFYAIYDSLDGIEAAIQGIGGFETVWPKFEMYLLNREPRLNFKQLDNIPIGAGLEADRDVSLGGAVMQTYPLRGDADHLAGFFHQFAFIDPDIRYVKFTHKLADDQTAHVRALIKYESDPNWADEEWTDDDEKTFCYDDPGQKKIEKLIIIISNTEFQDRGHVLSSDPQPELEVRRECTLSGQGRGTYHFNEGYYENWQATADVEWIEDPDFFPPGWPARAFFAEGTAEWEWELGWGSDYGTPCSESHSGSVTIGPHDIANSMILWEDAENEDQYILWAKGVFPTNIVSVCGAGNELTWIDVRAHGFELPTPTVPPFPFPFAAAPGVQSSSAPPCESTLFAVQRDATSIFGTCSDANGLLVYEWDFSFGGH
jgi:hypothetical protein